MTFRTTLLLSAAFALALATSGGTLAQQAQPVPQAAPKPQALPPVPGPQQAAPKPAPQPGILPQAAPKPQQAAPKPPSAPAQPQQAAQPPAAVKPPAAPKEDKVVVKVNGYEIKTSEVKLAADDILPQVGNVPPQMRYPFVVEYLIERHLLAQLAIQTGMDKSEEYKKRLAFYQAKALRDAVFDDRIKPAITDTDIKTAYETEAKAADKRERVRARHILVKTDKEAKDLLARVRKGENFEELAKQFSQDGSAKLGGDLGFFAADEMVEAFSKVAFALKTGQVSEPVQTEFGWHIVKLEDRKMGEVRPFEEVRDGVRAILVRKRVQDVIAQLRDKSKIEFVDPDLQRFQQQVEQAKAQQQSQQQQQPQQAPQQPTGKGDKVQ